MCVCVCVCCRPIVTQLHNRFQFPSPACLPGGSPPTAALCCLPAACLPAWLLDGLGQIRADQFRVLSAHPVRGPSLSEEDPAVSWWTFLPSRGIHNSGDRGEVCPEVRTVFLFLIVSDRFIRDVVTFQPNFDAAGWTSSLSPSLPLSRSLSSNAKCVAVHTHMREYGMFTQTVNKPRAVRFPSASLKGPAHEAPQLLLSIRAACVLCLCACVCVR